MTKVDMATMLQQFLAAQSNGTTVNVAPVAVEEVPTPTPVIPQVPTPVEPVTPTPELASAQAELTKLPTDPAALAELLKAALGSTATTSPGVAKSAKAKAKWESCDVELPNGEKLHLRVAPKGYGCVGFESRNDYSCIFGYRQRHEVLANLFGEGYRTTVFDRLVEMGLKDYDAE